MTTPTYFGLLAEFNGRAEIPLEEVSPRYFGINPRTASAQALPVPAYRTGDSQKAPWLVSAIYLAHCSLTLAEGRADLYPETPVRLTGYKAAIDATPWLITEVTHELTDSAYTTSLEMEIRGA